MKGLQSIYTSYSCKKCSKEFILLTEEVGCNIGYLVCPYCSSKNVSKETETNNIKECMGERSYKRVRGALRQKGR